MRAVADELGVTTSTVSQQIAALAGEVGTALIEPDGRRVRLTPAGRRLAEHAVTILAAVDAARARSRPGTPSRPAPCASPGSPRRSAARCCPPSPRLATDAPRRAPADPRARAARGPRPARRATTVDLALVYDYNLAPAALDRTVEATPLWSAELGPRGPGRRVRRRRQRASRSSPRCRDADWIVNSRNTADEDVVRILASMAGFAPRDRPPRRQPGPRGGPDRRRARRRAAPPRPAGRTGRAAAAPASTPTSGSARTPSPAPVGWPGLRSRSSSIFSRGGCVPECGISGGGRIGRHCGDPRAPRIMDDPPSTDHPSPATDRTGWVSPR